MDKILKDRGRPYTYDADVVKVQQMLENAGFSIKYGVDGKYGKATASAVTAYQKTYGLKVDGIVGKETWGHMTREQNTDNDVLKAQRLLNFLGYKAGAEDAIYGKKTKAAVTKFQRKMGIAVDGILGKETWGELNHMNSRFKAWNFDNVKQFQAVMSISPDGVAGKNTRALLDGAPIVPQDNFDFSCQCRAAGKNYCFGWNGLTEAEAMKRLYSVRVLYERIMREVEKKYPTARQSFYLTTVATPSPTRSTAGGVRCPRWNKERGGASGSKHLYAYAMDVYSDLAVYRAEFGRQAMKLSKYNGAHVYGSGAIHIDVTGGNEDEPRRRRW